MFNVPVKGLLKVAENATWFMIIDPTIRRSYHDLYMDNERDLIIKRYGDRRATSAVGMGGESFTTAQSVKIVLS